MKIELKPGVRYSVSVRASIGTPLGLQLLKNRLQAVGFSSISIDPLKDLVKVSARYDGQPQIITVDYDVKSIEAVA